MSDLKRSAKMKLLLLFLLLLSATSSPASDAFSLIEKSGSLGFSDGSFTYTFWKDGTVDIESLKNDETNHFGIIGIWKRVDDDFLIDGSCSSTGLQEPSPSFAEIHIYISPFLSLFISPEKNEDIVGTRFWMQKVPKAYFKIKSFRIYKEPNQALQTRCMLVTFCAVAQPAPSMHLSDL
jgi:hypothetical protein